MNYKSDLYLAVVASIALLMGAAFYLIERPPESVYFISKWLPEYDHQIRSVFGAVGNYLPTFLHVYAFILFTVIAVSPASRKVFPICLGWFMLESLFELAQHDSISHWISTHVPDWFNGVPFLENTSNYFLLGTFDLFDLFSIAAGTLAACLTIYVTDRRVYNDKPK